MASSPNLLQKIRRRIAKTSSCTYNILDSDACHGMDVYMKRCNVNPSENPYSMQETVTRDLFNGNIKFEDFPYHFRFIKDEGLGHFTFDPDLIAPEEPNNFGGEKNGNKIEVPVTVETTPKKHVSPPRLKRLDPSKKGNTIPRRKNLKPGPSNGTMCDVNNGNKIIDTVINCRNSTTTLDKKRLPTPPEEGGQVLTFSTFKGDPLKDMGPPQLPPRNKNKEGTLDVMSRSYPGPTINDNDPILQKNSLTVDNEYVRVGDGKPLPKVSPPLLKPLRNRTASESSSSDKNRSSRSMSESSSDQNVKMRSISESSSDQNVKLRSSSESSTELMKTSVLESPEESVFHINPVPEIQNDHLFRDVDPDDFPPPPPPILVEAEHNQISPIIGETVILQEDYPPPPDFLTEGMDRSSFPGPMVYPGPKVSDSRDTVSSLLQSPEEGSTSGVTDLGSPDRLLNNSDYKIEDIREVPMTGQVYAGVNRNEDDTVAPSSAAARHDQGAAGGLDEEDEDYDTNAEDGGFFEDVRDDILKHDPAKDDGSIDSPSQENPTRRPPPPLPDRNYRAEAYAKSGNSSSEEQDDHDYSAYHSSGYAGVDLQDAEPIHMTMEEVWQEARSKGIPLAKPQALASPNKRTKHKDEEKNKRRSFFKEKFKMPNFFRSKSEPDGRKSPRIHKKTLSDVSSSPVHNLSPMHPHFSSNTVAKQSNKRCSSSSMGSSTSFGEHPGRCGACKDQSETGSQHTSSAGSWTGHNDTDDTDGSIQSNADFIESLRKLKDCGWYWGPMNWDDAEQKLSNKPDGSFLVRDSSDDRYILSLSFRSQGTTHHTRIEHYKGMFSFYSQPKSHGAATIIEFIQKAMEHSRSGKFLYFLRPRAPGLPPAPVQLLFPVSRFRLLQSMQHMCRFVILKHVRYDHIDQLPLPEKLKAYLKESQYYTEYILDEGNGEFSEL